MSAPVVLPPDVTWWPVMLEVGVVPSPGPGRTRGQVGAWLCPYCGGYAPGLDGDRRRGVCDGCHREMCETHWFTAVVVPGQSCECSGCVGERAVVEMS